MPLRDLLGFELHPVTPNFSGEHRPLTVIAGHGFVRLAFLITLGSVEKRDRHPLTIHAYPVTAALKRLNLAIKATMEA